MLHAAILIIALSTETQTISGKVVRIKDGDTVVVLVEGRQIDVRLNGIDSPEKKQPFGTRSREHLGRLCHDRDVQVETAGKDRYGRTLGTIYVDSLNVNRQMVEDGMAWWYVKYSADKRLMISEHDAREFRRGLWTDDNPIPPWEWRSLQKSQK